jgi:hypothetical protein
MTEVQVAYYFVDEAGDLTLFGRRGKNPVGTEGVSHCFMVGMARIADPRSFRDELNGLRAGLLADPYLRDVPSMQSERKKTSRCFHAKNDCVEVREKVFRFLAGWDIKVQVGIRRKRSLIEEARRAESAGLPWKTDSVYDQMVTTLFKRPLHKADRNVITFARRGKSDRERALADAIGRAQANFERDTGVGAARPTKIISAVPSESCGLQAIDYFLWALQRFYERDEARYFNYLALHYRLIMDFDDKRNGKAYGTWYSDDDPLTGAKKMSVMG